MKRSAIKRRTPLGRSGRLPRASTKGRERDRLHGLWRSVLLARDGERCSAAGEGGMKCGGPLQAHHIYPKGAWPSMRFDLENGTIACAGHHRWWIHSAPSSEVQPWLERVCGKERLARLHLRAQTCRGRRGGMDLAAVKLWLEQEFQRLENRP